MIKFLLRNNTIRRYFTSIYLILRDEAHKEYVDRIKALYKIHPSFRVGTGTIISGTGAIVIGEDSYIGNNSFITSEPQTATITIGKHCSLAHNIHIRTQTHVKKRYYKDELVAPIQGSDISIGNYVWVGANVYIGGGVTIGENSIIGANSVVTHDVPPNSIFGGVPAHQLCNKMEYPD